MGNVDVRRNTNTSVEFPLAFKLEIEQNLYVLPTENVLLCHHKGTLCKNTGVRCCLGPHESKNSVPTEENVDETLVTIKRHGPWLSDNCNRYSRSRGYVDRSYG